MTVRCFLIEPNGKWRTYYRRYSTDGSACSNRKRSYHDASVLISTDVDGDHVSHTIDPTDADRADPRWPTVCASCGFVFGSTGVWQISRHPVYASAEGVEMELHDARPGAMWHAYWLDRVGANRAPDGKNLIAICPDGSEWWIDGPASNGPGWTRTGTPPNVTCSPSILVPGYHGFLRDGVFTGDVDGRKD